MKLIFCRNPTNYLYLERRKLNFVEKFGTIEKAITRVQVPHGAYRLRIALHELEERFVRSWKIEKTLAVPSAI